jgi:hypothetical protein
MNHVKRLGPRTDPWGTPALTDWVSDNVFSIFTLKALSVRYDWINLIMYIGILY